MTGGHGYGNYGGGGSGGRIVSYIAYDANLYYEPQDLYKFDVSGGLSSKSNSVNLYAASGTFYAAL